MTADLGAFLRIRGEVRSVVKRLGDLPKVGDRPGLADTYNRLREGVLSVLQDPLRSEFAQRFPDSPGREPVATLGPQSVLAERGAAAHLVSELARMEGWLNGLIEEHEIRARIRAETGATNSELD